jgi:hypothetical protein
VSALLGHFENVARRKATKLDGVASLQAILLIRVRVPAQTIGASGCTHSVISKRTSQNSFRAPSSEIQERMSMFCAELCAAANCAINDEHLAVCPCPHPSREGESGGGAWRRGRSSKFAVRVSELAQAPALAEHAGA